MDWKEMKGVFWKLFKGCFVIGLSFIAGTITMLTVGSSKVVQDRLHYLVIAFLFGAFLIQFYSVFFGRKKKVRRTQPKETDDGD